MWNEVNNTRLPARSKLNYNWWKMSQMTKIPSIIILAVCWSSHSMTSALTVSHQFPRPHPRPLMTSEPVTLQNKTPCQLFSSLKLNRTTKTARSRNKRQKRSDRSIRAAAPRVRWRQLLIGWDDECVRRYTGLTWQRTTEDREDERSVGLCVF